MPQDIKIGFGHPDGIGGIHALGWRRAMERGFRAAFGDAYRIVDESTAPDLVLEILETAPTIVVEDGDGPRTSIVELRFKVRLSARGGRSRPFAGTASSRRSILYGADIVVSSAIEVMYEEIATALFAS